MFSIKGLIRILREFWKEGHTLYVISPIEKRTGKNGGTYQTDKATIIKPVINDMQKVGYVKKVISMFTIEPILVNTIKKNLSNVKFDIVLYATPPITFQKAVKYVKDRDHVITYLLQKDIFPEGLLDLEVLTLHGWKGLVYKYYRNKEKRLLKTSDYIGCMSQANIEYIRDNNQFLAPEIVELCPNSIDIIDKSVDVETRISIRRKYDIPLDKKIFIYGGNLGQPQGIPFLVECLRKCMDIDAYFLIVGDGTEYKRLEDFIYKYEPQNIRLMKRLPKDDYDNMVGACDIGMILLDYRFTIPNIPSRLLSYMQAKLPVLAATDPNTDLGKIIENGEFGWWCRSDNVDAFVSCVKNAIENDNLLTMGHNAYSVLTRDYNTTDSARTIMSHMVN